MAGEDERTLVGLARKNKMRLLIEDGLLKVHQGLTTVQELLRAAGQVDVGPDWSTTLSPSDAGDVDAVGGEHRESRAAPGAHGDRASQGSQFDVAAYEALLGRWLQAANEARAEAPPVSACAVSIAEK
jgi:hypothetical protein